MVDHAEYGHEISRPRRYFTRMGLFLLAVAVIIGVLNEQLLGIVVTNPVLNSLILAAGFLGIAYIFRQVYLLGRNVDWIEAYMVERPGADVIRPPSMLAPMATLMRERRGGQMSMSAISMRSILDSVGARLDEGREISRYLIGLLIFLGLLGTFWGLLQTVGSVVEVIRSLQVGTGEVSAIFEDLKRGLEAPLSGMGTAFASSLLGLSGSLVLGFLDLQLGQAQNRFYNELEEWLSTQTRLSSAVVATGDGDGSPSAYVSALLEQTGESLINLQKTVASAQEGRATGNATMMRVAERLSELTEVMQAEHKTLVTLAERQDSLHPLLEMLVSRDEAMDVIIDEETRNHIRNLETHFLRVLEENAAGRDELLTQLKQEMKLLTRTVAAALDKPRQE